MEFLWENVLHKIRENISKPSYETWFKSTKAELNENTLTIISPNSFARDWIENHYGHMISEIIKEIFEQSYEIIFVSATNVESVNIKNSSSKSDHTYDSMNTPTNQIKKQQEKINELEKRIQVLEQKLEAKINLPLDDPLQIK
ncbi:DnaA N-terminal domain-containing protein [Lysinibacillus sp. NPDC097287]|uniref:DnaA N-terminal domain-containing protein n=1 Tax=Lysinibacillus sp. NPDC097287 TaxID=3364144 RepID=UPI003806DE7B